MIRTDGHDNPVEHPEQDAFNRWPFSCRLAATIVSLDTSAGAPVLGLFGSWGSGKSTVLNFVRVALEQDHRSQITVFAFNPWLFSDAGSLLQDFFKGLAAAIGTTDKKASAAVGEKLATYGQGLVALPVVGQRFAKILEAVGKDLAKDTIQNKRERLVQAMTSLSGKVVVLIDDLDRVDREEVMTVLKLVRLVANLPNVIYLLAFDDRRVANLAGQSYGDAAAGEQFLEKIVQYPFALPAVSPSRLRAYVLEQARTASTAAGVEVTPEDWALMDHVVDELVRVLLTTPRQSIRYGNALRFALPMCAGEVDIIDQMIVEAIRVFTPSLYGHMSRLERLSLGSVDKSRDSQLELLGMSVRHLESGLNLAGMLLREDPRTLGSPEKPSYISVYLPMP